VLWSELEGEAGGARGWAVSERCRFRRAGVARPFAVWTGAPFPRAAGAERVSSGVLWRGSMGLSGRGRGLVGYPGPRHSSGWPRLPPVPSCAREVAAPGDSRAAAPGAGTF
jgi:hypothetical protein